MYMHASCGSCTSFSSCCRCYITATPYRHAKREDATNDDIIGSMFPQFSDAQMFSNLRKENVIHYAYSVSGNTTHFTSFNCKLKCSVSVFKLYRFDAQPCHHFPGIKYTNCMMFVQLLLLTLYASIDSVHRSYHLTYLGMWIAHMENLTHWWCNANFNLQLKTVEWML